MDKHSQIQTIQQSLDHQDYIYADILANEAIAALPNEAFGYFYSALCAFRTSNEDKAKTNLAKSLSLDPDYIDALLLQANLNAVENGAEAAKAAYAQLLAKAANNPQVHTAAAENFIALGELNQAFEHLETAIGLDAQHLPAYFIRAGLYQNLQENEQALADINKCLEIKPLHAELLQSRVKIHTDLGNIEGAEADYLALIASDERNLGYLMDFASFLLANKQYKQAENRLDTLLDFNPESSVFMLQRAQARFGQKKYEDALEDCKSALLYDALNPEIYLLIADIKLGLYDTEEAIAILSEGIDKYAHESTRLHKRRGELFMKEYDFFNAAEDFKKLAESVPDAGEGYYLLGKAYQEQSNLQEAYEAWKLASENFHPDADAAIEEFCGEIVAEALLSEEARLLVEYAPIFEQNAASAFLQPILGKYWKFDEKATIAKNEVFKELPKEMRDQILEAFEQMVVFINQQGILFMNPNQEDFRALYKIESESANLLKIITKPLNGSREKPFTLRVDSKKLCMDGFAEEAEFELQFSETESLRPLEQKVFEMRKIAGSLTFLGI